MFDKLHGKPLLADDDEEEEDKDVRAERERVTSGQANYDMLQLQNLTKVYHHPRRRIVAVNNVNIGIPAGEVSPLRRGKGCNPRHTSLGLGLTEHNGTKHQYLIKIHSYSSPDQGVRDNREQNANTFNHCLEEGISADAA